MDEQKLHKIGMSIAMGSTTLGRAQLKHLSDLETYRARFHAYGLSIEKADSIVSYIVDRFGPGSMEVMKVLENIQKGLSGGFYTADNINTIYTAPDDVLLGNALALAMVLDRDRLITRLQSVIVAGQRAELAMKLDKYLPFPVASFIANHWPVRWLK